jgi:starvation-inducible DNA-binding protein
VKNPVSKELYKALVDTYGLYLATQGVHWNVRGKHFYEIHIMLEEQYKDMAEATDLLAERIRQLGDHIPVSFDEFKDATNVKFLPNETGATDMISKLIENHEQVISCLEKAVKKADEADDFATEDMATERIREHGKMKWMLQMQLDKND